MKIYWKTLCLTMALALTACGGGSGDAASTQGQYNETLGSKGERVVILSPTPGQVFRMGDTVQFVVRLENARLHPSPSTAAIQAAQDYWHAKHMAGAPATSAQNVQAKAFTLPDPAASAAPTAAGWFYQTAVADHPTDGRAITHIKDSNLSPIVSGDQYIYSFPATMLVANFSDHHLMCASETGCGKVDVHTALQDPDGNPTGASTSVSIKVTP